MGDDDGLSYDELARRLDIDREQLDRDLAELTDRDFYMRGGEGADIQIALETDRVRVWTTGHLQRPTRLSNGEAAALDSASASSPPSARTRSCRIVCDGCWRSSPGRFRTTSPIASRRMATPRPPTVSGR